MRGPSTNSHTSFTRPTLLAGIFALLVVVGKVGPLAEEPHPSSVRLSTRDGDLVIGTLTLTEIPVQTEYGLLRVPTEDVAVVEFARRLTDDDIAEIRATVETLRTSEEGEERDAARESLIQRGSLALDLLRSALNPEHEDLNKSLNKIIEAIIEREPEDFPTTDRIVARRFTISGHVQIDKIGLRCSYGDLELSRNDVARIVIGTGSWRNPSSKVLIFKSWTDTSGEYQNVMNFLPRQTKLQFKEFESRDPSLLRKALRKFSVIVVPELEQSDEGLKKFSSATAKALRKFVRNGGHLVSCGGNGNNALLNRSGLLKFRAESNSSPVRVLGKHSLMRGVSGSIPHTNATYQIHPQGGPRVQPLATTVAGGIVVGVAKIGQGAVVYCGWDFHNSTQDHKRILANAVLWAAGRLGER